MNLESERDGWSMYQKHILAELVRHNKLLDEMNRSIVAIKMEIAVLKLKSGMWGALASAVVMIGGLLVYRFRGN